MSQFDKMDDCKKEIRSILIPYQRGCHLAEFNRAYREFIGKKLPSREMGYRTDIEFLRSMPDVVRITPTGTGEYHLLGIADEKSRHIQKMVAKQKPAKYKPPPLRYSKAPSRSYTIPPRFSEVRTLEPPKVSHRVYQNEPEIATKNLPKDEPKLPPKISPKEEVISLIQHFNNSLRLDEVMYEYQKLYNKSLSLSKYGFSSIEECIELISELEIVQRDNITIVRCRSESSDVEDKNVKDSHEFSSIKNSSFDESPVSIPPPKVPATLNSDYSNHQNIQSGNIPNSLREKLQKVADRFTEGIYASEFPNYFEEVTGHNLNVCDVGYRCLGDLIDDVPDIFIRKPVAGSRKDYIIYPVGRSTASEKKVNQNYDASGYLSGPSLVNHVVLNLRKILQACPEGIKLNQVLNTYSINCKDSLYIKDFGFDNLETFLSSIKNLVPLRFHTVNGEKSIHLLKLSDNFTDLHNTAPEVYDKEAIPFDAVFPEFGYKPKVFPPDFDFSKFIPAYTSSVAHAGHLYIQLQDEDTEQSLAFTKLGLDLDTFYNGSLSEQYIMKTIHIKVGASCIAKWPVDQHWYRAEILSISSLDSIQVHYVDYGTKDNIPMFLLRYAKKEFTELPVQAIKCRLAFLKPPNNAAKWDMKTRQRILKLCEDIPLMAKIEEIGPDGIYSILLCDTNGKEDIYINDVLRNEGLAEYDIADPNRNSASPEPMVQYNLNPIQALQAQYYLQAFATVAPPFSQNENYIKLLRLVSMYCQNSDPMQQNIMPIVPPGFNSVPSLMNPFPNPNAFYNASSGAASNFGTSSIKKSNVSSIIPPPVGTVDFFSPSPECELSAPEVLPEGNVDGDNELFDDDDDEIFQQFCQGVSSPNIQFVKRVILGDGYKIHIIVVESKPYASSGDISQLIWNNKEADYLLRRLQVKDVDIPAISLSEDGNEELFQQLFKFNVKGAQKTTGFKSSIVLYPLVTVIKILNLFGHPSITLRTRLTEEIASFNPNDVHWNECSPDTSESDEEDIFSGITDDDKIERLCLFDLLAMKESLWCKRKKILSNGDLNKGSYSDEIDKLEQKHDKVLRRIKEVEEICKVFA